MNPWAGHPSKVNGEGRQTEVGARVVDNSSIHSTPAIKRWLKRHPRFHLHFTPTYSSWLNLVERWFANLTDQACAAAATRAHPSSKTRFTSTSKPATTRRNPSFGPRPPIKSWRASLVSALGRSSSTLLDVFSDSGH